WLADRGAERLFDSSSDSEEDTYNRIRTLDHERMGSMSRFFLSTCLWVAPLLVGVWGGQPVAVAADGIPSERRLPLDVVAYGTIRSGNELKSEWSKTYFSKLFSERELSDFWQELKSQWGTISDKVRDQTGLTLDEILTIPQGEISAAIMQTGGKPVAFVVLIDIGDRKADVQ